MAWILFFAIAFIGIIVSDLQISKAPTIGYKVLRFTAIVVVTVCVDSIIVGLTMGTICDNNTLTVQYHTGMVRQHNGSWYTQTNGVYTVWQYVDSNGTYKEVSYENPEILYSPKITTAYLYETCMVDNPKFSSWFYRVEPHCYAHFMLPAK